MLKLEKKISVRMCFDTVAEQKALLGPSKWTFKQRD